jgi:flagellar P-ring protein precursor FlgI
MKTAMRYFLSGSLIAAVWLAFAPVPAWARTRLENICTVQGQQEVRLTGMGLVIGLPGTGDGAKNLPTVRALRAALFKMNQPVMDNDVKNADSVAVVLIEASVPRTGMRRGQKLNVHVSTIMGAKSLRGGRLLSTPLTQAAVKSDSAIALAAGAITLEDATLPTTGLIAMGAELLTDVRTMFVNNKDSKKDVVTLLIDPAKMSFWTASEVARVVNIELRTSTAAEPIAKAVGPGAVEVTIPKEYRDSPVEFIAEVLEVGIDNPHTQARVVLNTRTGIVTVTGEVEISPTFITHKNYNIEIGTDPDDVPDPFIAMMDGQTRQSPQQLQQLLTSLNKLKVPKDDLLEIIRELHAAGKLHAELLEK